MNSRLLNNWLVFTEILQLFVFSFVLAARRLRVKFVVCF